jgi:hypothetical protein
MTTDNKYQLWTMDLQDAINENWSVHDIVRLERFKTLVSIPEVTFESVTITDLEQEIDGKHIVSMLCLDIVIAGETFHIYFSTHHVRILRAIILFAVSIEAKQIFRDEFN